MDFRETLSALMLPPRDDEPASLRQNILDELGDHLAFANNRELLCGANSQLAKQRVLERFGDPAAVAHRLWLDAMKGKIMAQRMLIATCMVVTLASLSLVGLVWMQSRRAAAETTEANRKLSESLAQANITNKGMLVKLDEMAKAIQNPRSTGWNAVTFKLVEEGPGGLPAVGFSVELTRAEEPEAKATWRTSDASGGVEFGSMNPGDYQFVIKKTWDDGNQQRTSGFLNVQPGVEVVKQISCPRIPPEHAPVQLQCRWPADLANRGLFLHAFFISQGQTTSSGWQWDFYSSRSWLSRFGPDAKLIEIQGNRSFWNNRPGITFRVEVATADLRKVGNQGDSVEWDAGNHSLFKLTILRRSSQSPDEAGKSWFDVLATASSPSLSDSKESATPVPETYWQGKSATLVVCRGQTNTWTIPVPEELFKAAREKLNREPSAK
jgi:hypothetical protein